LSVLFFTFMNIAFFAGLKYFDIYFKKVFTKEVKCCKIYKE